MLLDNFTVRNVFTLFLVLNVENDSMLKTVFWTRSSAVDFVECSFVSYVND